MENFRVEKVPLDRQDSQFCSEDIHILKLRRLAAWKCDWIKIGCNSITRKGTWSL